MSKRAEQRALEAYPDETFVSKDYASMCRSFYVEGYEQAWKDIKEWVEEQVTILDKQTLLHPDDDVFWVHRNLFKEMKDKINSL